MSLLAPSPEIAALFDELILIDEGRIIYSGPIGESLNYFESLGYSIPDRIDVADWILVRKYLESVFFFFFLKFILTFIKMYPYTQPSLIVSEFTIKKWREIPKWY